MAVAKETGMERVGMDMTKVLSWLAIIPARIHIGNRSSFDIPYGDGDSHGSGGAGGGNGMGEDYGTYDGDGIGYSYEELSGYGERDGDSRYRHVGILY